MSMFDEIFGEDDDTKPEEEQPTSEEQPTEQPEPEEAPLLKAMEERLERLNKILAKAKTEKEQDKRLIRELMDNVENLKAQIKSLSEQALTQKEEPSSVKVEAEKASKPEPSSTPPHEPSSTI